MTPLHGMEWHEPNLTPRSLGGLLDTIRLTDFLFFILFYLPLVFEVIQGFAYWALRKALLLA